MSALSEKRKGLLLGSHYQPSMVPSIYEPMKGRAAPESLEAFDKAAKQMTAITGSVIQPEGLAAFKRALGSSQ